MQTVSILGRQPALGLAELESRFGAAAVQPLGYEGAAGLDVAAKDFPLNELGGTVKAAKVLTYIESTNWRDIAAYLIKTVPDHLKYLPAEGKLKLGLSAYGLKVHSSEMGRTGLELKKVIKRTGRSVRIVPNASVALSSATVQHNMLTGDLGWELIAIADGRRTILAQTFAIQDIEAYAARDQVRPMRDARVGMLPPKLAQIIVNLAVPGGSAGDTAAAAPDVTVLDPFCGTGVILQEASLLGFGIYGSDIDARMVQYTGENLRWLETRFGQEYPNLPPHFCRLETGDATNHHWQPAPPFVASETYLGSPLSSLPDPHKLAAISRACNTVLRKFLQNFSQQAPGGCRLCLAVPAWQTAPGVLQRLPVEEYLAKLGYERVAFRHVRADELCYFRPGQLVARELLVLRVRK